MAGGCETPIEDTPEPTEGPTVATPAPARGIGVSRAEMQSALEADPFGFVFDSPYELTDWRSMVLGYSLEEGQEGMVELIGPPSNLTKITLTTPIAGAYARIGLLRLSEVASHVMPQRERRQGIDVWIGDHGLLAVEEGPQSTRYNDICMEMKWLDDLQIMTLIVERCAPRSLKDT